jgi:hypothetical protein
MKRTKNAFRALIGLWILGAVYFLAILLDIKLVGDTEIKWAWFQK